MLAQRTASWEPFQLIASYPSRRFQLWVYRVSHGSLLIRSPRTQTLATNIDLIFAGVEYVAAPRMIPGITLREVAPEDCQLIPTHLLRNRFSRAFEITSEDHVYTVVAATVRIDENVADIFSSPFHKDS